MQAASFSIWTRVADSISYSDNHYANHASLVCMYVCMYVYKEVAT